MPTADNPEGLGARPERREIVEIRRGATEDQASHFLGDSIQDLRLVNGRVPLINLDLLDTPDDVKIATEKIAHLYKDQIDVARRGVITHAQTIKLADDLGMTVDDLLTGMRPIDPADPAKGMMFEQGSFMSPEEIFAARRIMVSVNHAMLQAAKKVQAGINVTDADKLAVQRLLALSGAVQARVHGFMTETARAMNAFKIPAGDTPLARERVRELIEQFGGDASIEELSKAIVRVAEEKGSAGLAKLAREAWHQKVLGIIQQTWINALLSAPPTHLINLIGNMIFATLQPFERFVAAGIGAGVRTVKKGRKDVGFGEALTQVHGMLMGTVDGIRLAGRVARRGDVLPRPGDKPGKGWQAISDRSMEGNFRRDYYRAEVWNLRTWHTTAWRTMSILQALSATAGSGLHAAGFVANLPSRALLSADQFFRAVHGRGELHARAWRLAREEGLRQGWGIAEMRTEYHRLLNEPTREMEEAATLASETGVFQAKLGKITGPLAGYINLHPMLKFIFPFVRTPSNIFKASWGERTILAALNKQARDEWDAGGARRDIAVAKVALGSAITLTGAYLAANGLVTGYGPGDPDQRKDLMATGWRPYSIVLIGLDGKKLYIAYNRLEPVAALLAVAADFRDAWRYQDVEDWDGVVQGEKVLAAIITSITNSTLQKSYLTGLSDLIEVFYDPKRYAKKWLERFAGSAIPAGVAYVTKVADPVRREVDSLMDAWRSRIPGLSDSLPAQRDLFGDPLEYDSTNTFWQGISLPIAGWAKRGLAQSSPIYVSEEIDHLVEREIVANDAQLSMPGRHIGGVKMTPEEYSDFMDFLGHGLLVDDVNGRPVTLKQAMETLMKSRQYLDDPGGPDSYRTTAIRALYTEAVALARKFYQADPANYRAMKGSIVKRGFDAPDAADLRIRIKKRAALTAARGQPGAQAQQRQRQALRELEQMEKFFRPLKDTPETADAQRRIMEQEQATP